MYMGRDYELKQKLAEMIIFEVEKYAQVDRRDVNPRVT